MRAAVVFQRMNDARFAAACMILALAAASGVARAETSDDLLAAREAAILECSAGGISPAPAQAEDRWLASVGRPQRFGTLAGEDGKPAQPVAKGVPEALRADFLVPPLLRAHDRGVQDASVSAMSAMQERLASRRDATPDARLAQLASRDAKKPLGDVNREEVLEMLRTDRVRHAEDFANAARVLGRSKIPDDLLLANELAAAAACRRAPGALELYARTWDRFAAASRLPARYGTSGAEMAASVLPAMRQALAQGTASAPAGHAASGGGSGSRHAAP